MGRTVMDPDVGSIVSDLCDMLQRYNKEQIPLTAETSLGSELNIDSVEVMDLIMEIEDRFNIDIPINLISDVERIEDLAKLVDDRMKGR
ncbi:MAG TPA: acyl carrier protein [Rhodospirillales bacterium]|nr:acyl carrier protein [Rhodospirillales bacterium]